MYVLLCVVIRYMEISMYLAMCLVASYMEISMCLVMCFVARYREISMYLAISFVARYTGNFHVPCHKFRCKVHGNFRVLCHVLRCKVHGNFRVNLAMCFVARYMEISVLTLPCVSLQGTWKFLYKFSCKIRGNFHVPCHVFRSKVHGNFHVPCNEIHGRYMEISMYLAMSFVIEKKITEITSITDKFDNRL